MRHYINGLDRVIGASDAVARMSSVVGADPAPAAPAPAAPPAGALVKSDAMSELPAALQDHVKDGPQTIVGAGLGFLAFPEHRVLGVIGGGSLGRNLPALLKADQRKDALCNMGQTAAAIAGSRMFKGHPVWGFILGTVIGGAAIEFSGVKK
jgi:hypothetical protein